MIWKFCFLIIGLWSCRESSFQHPVSETASVDALTTNEQSIKKDAIPLNNVTTIEKDTLKSNEVAPKRICGVLEMDYIMGKFDPAKNGCFELVPASLADKSGLFLRKETLSAFKEMLEAAKKDGINLRIISATRNFEYQKGIWERKWSGQTKLEGNINASKISNKKARAEKIMRYSAMPGASRHHWGTDIDINELNNKWFESGTGKKVYDWLQTKGKEFGFYQVYTSKAADNRAGYEEEKWHYTYKPVSAKLTNIARETMHDEHLSNFSGSEQAKQISVVQKYVLGISEACWK
ncbi:MAG TPA: M15 family metallopeptidase [Saprospiraceae bacterium]|nr:M15 family metallopeptidase [Saprospiraceae bacterium]HPN70872.1 M15 family metallopeptidase [Saprospiraceae bacterium]